MSKTRRGNKAPGYEYWSKRPCSGLGYGKDIKKKTKRKERQMDRKLEHDAKYSIYVD